MCGIAGIFFPQGHHGHNLPVLVNTMTAALNHRGPDDSGVCVDETAKLALGHARLAILDLAPTGHQPMVSASGRYVIVFNGEIYNFRHLRAQLDSQSPHNWRGSSDTEVLLAAIELWGIDKALFEINGMFAFALYDKQERSLTLARDRLGEKPLYYGFAEDKFIFASELKAVRAVLANVPTINAEASQLFFRYGYVPAPYTIYDRFFKLQPGHILTLSLEKFDEHVASRPYWTPAQFSQAPESHQSFEEAENRLEALLQEVVSQQAISDVPLGCFLSGGVDSSLVAALLQKNTTQKVQTFSIGFDQSEHNEAPFAKRVAEHIGAEHTEFYVTDREARDVIPLLPQIYDEPFADSSQIPTYLVSKLARQFVTVALSGDGADELFGGYGRYQLMQKLEKIGRFIPRPLARAMQNVLSLNLWPEMRVLRRAQGLFKSLAIPLGQAYTHHVSIWREMELVGTRPIQNELAALMLHDAQTYLPDDIMVKVDRASMANSLETRAPFMDRRIAEFALRLPLNYKMSAGQSKRILKSILYKHVPQALVDRPKMGFGVPLASWLRGPLKDWAHSVITAFQRDHAHLLGPDLVEKYWQHHQAGSDEQHFRIWCVLMYQSWYEAAFKQ